MLFNTNTNTPEKEVEQAKADIDVIFTSVVKGFMKEFNRFWRNENGFTPQQMAAAWGTDAVTLFTRSAATKAYLLSIDANALTAEYINPPMTVTPNQDGTVTLS